MISNQLNVIEGEDPERDFLKLIGNRIKTLRIRSGSLNYEKFAYQNKFAVCSCAEQRPAATSQQSICLELFMRLR